VAESLGSPARPVVMARLGDEDRAVMELARRSVQRWLPLVDRLPAVELLEQVLADAAYAFELGGPRRAQARENLKKLRELVRRMQNRGYATLAHIADRLDRLSTGDEANAVIDALDSVSLMTVHAAKGLEFPIVFLVNLGRGTGGGSMPIRVTAGADEREPSVSIGTPVEADEEERLREREETKRLFYVGVTRARDRLYLSAVLAGDRPAPSRGSLAEVMPASLWQLFRDVVDGPDDRVQIDWRAGETALHGFRICRAGETPSSTRQRPPPTRETAPDDFGVLAPAPHMKRLAATERAAAQLREAEGSTPDDLAIRAATAADACGAIVDAAEVSRLLATGARLHEVPFSMRVDSETSTIVRGTIDCLIVRPDGRVIVLEFKTGRARPLHDAQLRIHVEAARRLFPGSEAIGYTVYGEAGGRVRVESIDPDDPETELPGRPSKGVR
jgi:ATP-dependent exoDNAse (exonuclease V) beta subunit